MNNRDGFAPGPGSAYRGETPRCPACGDALETMPAGAAEIDVCPRCGGLWFDWTDGDLASLARTATRQSSPGGALPAQTTSSGACPRCRDPLGDDTVRGITVARCGSCAGAFVTRAAAEEIVLAKSNPDDPKRASSLERIVAWIDDVLHPTRAFLRDAGVPPDSES